MPNRLPAHLPARLLAAGNVRRRRLRLHRRHQGQPSAAGWDLSSTYGKDVPSSASAHSGNVSLLADTGATPTDFYAGKFVASQWTNNLDISREFDVGWATPLNFAIGLEHRRDEYEIGAGDAASRYKEGSQSFPASR
jgi:iron complex outermembrane receptor protein